LTLVRPTLPKHVCRQRFPLPSKSNSLVPLMEGKPWLLHEQERRLCQSRRLGVGMDPKSHLDGEQS
jgi:hypothetical protein